MDDEFTPLVDGDDELPRYLDEDSLQEYSEEDVESILAFSSEMEKIFSDAAKWAEYVSSSGKSVKKYYVDGAQSIAGSQEIGYNQIISGSQLVKGDTLVSGWLVAPNIWHFAERVQEALQDYGLMQWLQDEVPEKADEILRIYEKVSNLDFGDLLKVLSSSDTTEADDTNVFSSLRTLSEISKRALSRLHDDTAAGFIKFKKGAQFSSTFVEGLTGKGGKIDENGNAWLRNLQVFEAIETPLLRYNRTDISVGNKWRSAGVGEISAVEIDTDDDGNNMMTGTITLHLESGEIGAVKEDDLCMGIFHDSVNLDNNETEDYDDSRGNFKFAGFYTCYFRVTEILESGNNSKFKYALRPRSERWKTVHHPAANMTFVGYGNLTDKERQSSCYETRTYQRYLKDVSTWEISDNNIAAQWGDLSNLSVFGKDMSGYSAYLNNIYMTGRIDQNAADPLRMEVEIDNDNYIAWGETKHVTCKVYKGWLDWTDKVTSWSVSRDSTIEQDDAAWALKEKVKSFAGEIDLSFSEEENDIGSSDYSIKTIFTFTATIDETNETATHTFEI